MSRTTLSILHALTAAIAMGIPAAGNADAAFVSSSPDPLLGGNLVSSGPPISSNFGFVTFNIANISQTTNSIVGTSNFITYTASPILSFYSDAALTNLVASSTFQGQFQIEVFNRTSAFQTGTFDFRFVSSTATGTVMGQSVLVQLDPTQPSLGTTSIAAGPGLGQFTINTSAVQYSQFTVNGQTTSIPPIPLAGVSAVPEPASLAMLALGLVGLGVVARRRA